MANIPLFIRCTQDVFSRNEKIFQSIEGIRTCSFVRYKYKDKDNLLSIKIEGCPYYLNVALHNDGYTLCFPFPFRNELLLPDEQDCYITAECTIQFVPFETPTANLFGTTNPQPVAVLLQKCKALPFPIIDMTVSEAKEMWQMYTDGICAMIEAKQEPIRVSPSTLIGNRLRCDIDLQSYWQLLSDSIQEALKGSYGNDIKVSVYNQGCLIDFHSYQDLSQEVITSLKEICERYAYRPQTPLPVNSIRGEITIPINEYVYGELLSSIERHLKEFCVPFRRTEEGNFEFRGGKDKDVDILRQITHKETIELVPVTRIVVPLFRATTDIDTTSLQKTLGTKQISCSDGQLIIQSEQPIDLYTEVLNDLSLQEATMYIYPNRYDDLVELPGTIIKSVEGKLCLKKSIRSRKEANGFPSLAHTAQNVKYLGGVRMNYVYIFRQVLPRETLQQLKLATLDTQSYSIDIRQSQCIFTPHCEQDYTRDWDIVMAQLGSEVCVPQKPSYIPVIRVNLLSDKETYRKDLFEKVNSSLKELKTHFTLWDVDDDARILSFEFHFTDTSDRDTIKRTLMDNLVGLPDLKSSFVDEYGTTTWCFTEDTQLLTTVNNQFNTTYRNEDVYKVVRTKKADTSNNQETIRLGVCRCMQRDYMELQLTPEVFTLFSQKKITINTVYFPIFGTQVDYSRQQNAMNRILQRGNRSMLPPINPKLCNFLFDVRYINDIKGDIDATKRAISQHSLGHLNEYQIEAVAKSILTDDLALIQGPPGTGKTTVITEIIWQLLQRDPECRILLTSQTNLAVDNALDKLRERYGIYPIRLAQSDKVESEGRFFTWERIIGWVERPSEDNTDNILYHHIEHIREHITSDTKYARVLSAWKNELASKDDYLRKRFKDLYLQHVNLIGTTCSFCGSKHFTTDYGTIFGTTEGNMSTYFDVVIMDETGKATPPEMAIPLVLGKKIILVGDHRQLPPTMDENTIDTALEQIGRDDLAKKLKQAPSQFAILFNQATRKRPTVVTTLDTQYRSHETIMKTYAHFYDEDLQATGGLKCGITATMDIPDLTNKGSRWHGIRLEPLINPSIHALWIDVPSPEIPCYPGFQNDGEVEAIKLLLKALQHAQGYKEFIASQQTVESRKIGIITFYKNQARALTNTLDNEKDYRIGVVDRFQGMERDIIILSTVRSNDENKFGFTTESGRINVALSRAKKLLIVVGNKQFFEKNEKYRMAIKQMHIVNINQLKALIR